MQGCADNAQCQTKAKATILYEKVECLFNDNMRDRDKDVFVSLEREKGFGSPKFPSYVIIVP